MNPKSSDEQARMMRTFIEELRTMDDGEQARVLGILEGMEEYGCMHGLSVQNCYVQMAWALVVMMGLKDRSAVEAFDRSLDFIPLHPRTRELMEHDRGFFDLVHRVIQRRRERGALTEELRQIAEDIGTGKLKHPAARRGPKGRAGPIRDQGAQLCVGQIVWVVDRSMKRHGHKVTLYGSRTDATVVDIVAIALRKEGIPIATSSVENYYKKFAHLLRR